MCWKKIAFLFICVLSSCATKVAAQQELNVISGPGNTWLQHTDATNALYHHFAEEAYGYLRERSETVAAIHLPDQWKERQRWISATLQKVTGPFPEKTPLNARVVRTVNKDAYRVEHIIFESQPGFYVTSSMFIPKDLRRREKAPAIIYCSGHTPLAYRSAAYQQVILNLVKKGFIVLAFDPVGQGERLEYFDKEKNASALGGPTAEHSYPGSQAFITGSSQARYMIWDGIRVVDYLLTRGEVDPERIGITGRSGGGTQSAYIAAFDHRIKAAAPECYITNFTRLLQSIGPQDAEQNLMHGIAEGLDHGDLLLVRAPRPALMITTTRDIFSIQGARETAKEVSRIYEAFGVPANFGMVEDDAPHQSTKKNREALYAFFQKHLQHPGLPSDEAIEALTEDELRVTETGQVSTSLGGESVFSLNRKDAEQKMKALEQSRNDPERNFSSVVEAAKSASGYRAPDEAGSPVFAGRIQRTGYAVEKYFIKGEGDYVVPYLLMVPAQPRGKAVLYLHPGGKHSEATENGEMESFVKEGFTVLAPDLPGIGELGPGDFRGDAFIGGVSHNIWYSSILVGRSVLGVQAGDIGRLLHALKNDHHAGAVYGLARDELTPLLLHAANFLPDIERVALIDAVPSYAAMVLTRFYPSAFIHGAVAGALAAYDLPDLAAALAPRQLLIMAKESPGTVITRARAEDQLIREKDEARPAERKPTIVETGQREALQKILSEWVQ